MLEFLRMVFLGALVDLTPTPIHIETEMVLVLDEPISAVASRPLVLIEVVEPKSPTDVFEAFDGFKKTFPDLQIDATLSGEEGGYQAHFSFKGGLSFDGERITIRLSPAEDMKIRRGYDFNRLSIKSNHAIELAKIKWLSGGHLHH